MVSRSDITPLSPTDRALLLELTDPSPPLPYPGADSPDALARAHFLARPDIQPHLEALQTYRAFRAEIEREHRVAQLADLLIQLAHAAADPAERRRAATAAIRLLFPARAPRPSGAAPSPSPPTSSRREVPHALAAERSAAPPRFPESIGGRSSETLPCTPPPFNAAAPSPSLPAPDPAPAPSPPSVPSVAFDSSDLSPSRTLNRRAQRTRLDRLPRRSRTQSLALAAGAAPLDTT